MAIKPFKKPKLLSEFLEICRNNEYFAATVTNAIVKNITFLRHMPKLQYNIEKLWSSNTNGTENNLKVYGNDEFDGAKTNLTLLDKYWEICKRDRMAKTIPFGLIDISRKGRIDQSNCHDTDKSDETVGVELDQGCRILTCSYLVRDKQSQEYFYRVPRLRKIWWMKYAAHPGRFLISEIKQDSARNSQRVTIKAKFPFGILDIEHIELLPLEVAEPSLKPTKSTPSNVIRTTAISEVAAIETVFDAIDAGDYGEMCFNRIIAPYHCAIYCVSEDPIDVVDLYDLSKYVSMLLEQSNITVMQTNDLLFSQRINLSEQFAKIDAIGIPYSLVLNADSLRTGFMKLRNRDTTLFETIHICHLTDYLPKIFQP